MGGRWRGGTVSSVTPPAQPAKGFGSRIGGSHQSLPAVLAPAPKSKKEARKELRRMKKEAQEAEKERKKAAKKAKGQNGLKNSSFFGFKRK